MRRNLHKVPLKIVLVGVLTVIFFLGLTAGSFAGPPWSDAPNSWWVGSYGVTEAEVATVADGYPDGTFKPALPVTRGQFAKMAVNGFDLEPQDPATPTFKDVARGSTFYTFIEGAYAADLIAGYSTASGLYFRPTYNITRQQAFSILARYLSAVELDVSGVIHGAVNNYASLQAWYDAEGAFYLNGFEDAESVAADHRATTAYLIYRGVVQGASAHLNPLATLTRSQAAVLILRVRTEAQELATPPSAPHDLELWATGTGVQVTQTGTATYVGNDATPRITGLTLPSAVLAVYDAPFYGTSPIKQDTSTQGGIFTIDLNDSTKPLVDGTHLFRAKVWNQNGVASELSAPLTYVLDTVAPTGTIAAPTVPAGESDAALNSNKPTFAVSANDERSGVKQVVFQYGVGTSPATWITIYTDTEDDDTSAAGFQASCVWGTTALADGQYQFRATVTDNAGNQTVLGPVPVTIDTTPPTVEIVPPCLEPSGDGIYYAEDNHKPAFGALGTDVTGGEAGTLASGVARIEFLYAPVTPIFWPYDWSHFTLISSDLGNSGYAQYPTAGIPDGYYIFAARAVDRAGNISSLLTSAYTPGTPPAKPPYDDNVAREVAIGTGITSLVLEGSKSSTVTFEDGDGPPTSWTFQRTYGTSSITLNFSSDTAWAWALRFHALHGSQVMDWATGGTPAKLKLKLVGSKTGTDVYALGPGYWATGAPNYPDGFGAFTGGWAYIYANVADLVDYGLNFAQTLQLQIWLDSDNDNQIDTDEVRSNVLQVVITAIL